MIERKQGILGREKREERWCRRGPATRIQIHQGMSPSCAGSDMGGGRFGGLTGVLRAGLALTGRGAAAEQGSGEGGRADSDRWTQAARACWGCPCPVWSYWGPAKEAAIREKFVMRAQSGYRLACVPEGMHYPRPSRMLRSSVVLRVSVDVGLPVGPLSDLDGSRGREGSARDTAGTNKVGRSKGWGRWG